MNQTASAIGITQVNVAMVPVSDVDAAIDFYVHKLGFELRADVPFGDGERWVEVAPAGSATAVALVPPRGEVQPGGSSRISFAAVDVDRAYAQMKDNGVDVDPEIMRAPDPVPPMFWFRDQDGNTHLLVQQA